MVYEQEFFDSLKWYINDYPNPQTISIKVISPISKVITNRRSISTSELNQVLFQEGIRVAYPLGDQYSVFVEETIAGPVTMTVLFDAIYNFYQREFQQEHYEDIFGDNEELEEEALAKCCGEVSEIKNIDTFSDYPAPPNFVGLTRRDDGVYVVDLGPV